MKRGGYTIFVLILFFSEINLFASSNDIVIANQSTGETVCRGASATLFIDAGDRLHSKMIYQWYFQNEKISGANSEQLIITNTGFKNSGVYYCFIKKQDGSDSVKSRDISLYVITHTQIINEPQDIILNPVNNLENITLEFQAHINGKSLQEAEESGIYIRVQWYNRTSSGDVAMSDNHDISGANSNRLNILASALPDTSQFYAVIEGQCGNDTTRICSVIKNYGNLYWVKQPDEITTCAGSPINFHGKAVTTLNFPIKYQWTKDGAPLSDDDRITGSTTTNLKIDDCNSGDRGIYSLQARLDETSDVIYSKTISPQISSIPVIIKQPHDTSFIGGEKSIVFHIGLEKSSITSTFTLFKNGNVVDKKIGLNYDFAEANIDTNVVGKYWCIVSNQCGTSFSDTIRVTFDDIFWIEKPLNQIECEGQGAVLKAEAGTHSGKYIMYQWYHADGTEVIDDDIDILGAKSTHLVFSTLKKEHVGKYYLKVWLEGTNIQLKSEAIDLKMYPVPIVAKQPTNRTVTTGTSDTVFHVEIEPSELPTYITITQVLPFGSGFRQAFQGQIIGTSFDFTVDDMPDTLAGNYYADIVNKCGAVRTNEIVLTILEKTILSNLDNIYISDDFKIFPNPTSDVINISSKYISSPEIISIYDMLGNKIYETIYDFKPVKIDFLQNGTYFISYGNKKAIFQVIR